MSHVRKIAKKAAKRQLKKPVAYAWIVSMDNTAPDEEKLLRCIEGVDNAADSRKCVESILRPRIVEFRRELGYLLGLYRARIEIDRLRPTPRVQRAYASRLRKHVAAGGQLPVNSQFWPPAVRYAPEVIAGAHPLDAVNRLWAAVTAAKAEAGQPPRSDRNRLIFSLCELIESYGINAVNARQYVEHVLIASKVSVPKIGDEDGRALRLVRERGKKRQE